MHFALLSLFRGDRASGGDLVRKIGGLTRDSRRYNRSGKMPELTRWFKNRRKRTVKPVCLVVHAMGEHIKADGIIPAWDWLEQSGLSVHALIYPNGTVLRSAHDEDVAYHAGKSRIVIGDKTWEGLNAVSLGA